MNAKTEFLEIVKEAGGFENLICAQLSLGVGYMPTQQITHSLKKYFSNDEYEQFLVSIDVSYDSGYGGQELFGTVWFQNGTWAERGEYDGAEWWELKKYPEIPTELINGN